MYFIFKINQLNKKKINKSLMRGIIPIPSISCAEMIDNKTGFIRLEQFSMSSGEEFHAAVEKLQKSGMKKLDTRKLGKVWKGF